MIRKLKDYRWELRDKVVWLQNLRTKQSFALDKVRLMSFIKFGVNCLDKMRIEEGKMLRAKVREAKQKTRDVRADYRAKAKAKRNQRTLFAKARKVK